MSRLCVCNVIQLGISLVKNFLVSTKLESKFIDSFTPITNDYSLLPEWVRTVLGITSDNPRIATNMVSLRNLPVSETEIDLSPLVNATDISESSVEILVEIIANHVISTEYRLDKELIWNEIIKNKAFYPNSTKTDLSDGHQKFFKEIISLKELYKEFERC